MLIHCGYDISYTLGAPTTLVLMLHLRPELGPRLRSPEKFVTKPVVPTETFLDPFGNRCLRLTVPAGPLDLRGEALVEDPGWPALRRHRGGLRLTAPPRNAGRGRTR